VYLRWNRTHRLQGSIVPNGIPSQGRNDEQPDHGAAQLAFLWNGAVTRRVLEEKEVARGRPRKKADRRGRNARVVDRANGHVQEDLGHR
jgi:hypothetical protein